MRRSAGRRSGIRDPGSARPAGSHVSCRTSGPHALRADRRASAASGPRNFGPADVLPAQAADRNPVPSAHRSEGPYVHMHPYIAQTIRLRHAQRPHSGAKQLRRRGLKILGSAPAAAANGVPAHKTKQLRRPSLRAAVRRRTKYSGR